MTATKATQPIRRVVTADDAQGRSFIAEDGPSPAVRLEAERPGYRVTNLWRTTGPQAGVDAPDSISEHKGVSPPKGGTVLRIIDHAVAPTAASGPRRHISGAGANRELKWRGQST